MRLTRRAAVLGRPIAHSRSPVLHRAAYRALGLDGWRYDAIECGQDELPRLLAGCGPEWIGFSCTMPLKRAVLDVAREVRPLAALAGAGNTLLPVAGGWAVDNTDVVGIVESLAAAGCRPASMAVLGAGGTAQAAVVAASRIGVRSVAVLVRSPDRTGDVLATAERAGIEVELGPLDADLSEFDLVVSTLPSRAADPFAARPWRPGQTVLDAVYDPWPTALAGAASAAGATVVGGYDLLLHQAAAQVELMTGTTAPLAAMREALDRTRSDT